MKPTTESAFLKFMAKVSKAIDSEGGGGEITPEDITPEMLSTAEFRQRLRLYGHTVEEVEQLIADGKCIRAYAIDDYVADFDEDIRYELGGVFLDKNQSQISKQDLENVQYILYASTDIKDGILLHRIGSEFFDSSSQFMVELTTNNYIIYIGNSTY